MVVALQVSILTFPSTAKTVNAAINLIYEIEKVK
jgi:hypothetical protein